MNIAQGSCTITWCNKGNLTVPFTVADSENQFTIKKSETWEIKKIIPLLQSIGKS
jgi:hypothetical protein